MAPHDPPTSPGEYVERYDPGALSLSESVAPEHPFDNGHLRGRDEDLEDHPRDPERVRRHLAEYYAIITHLDAQLGRVLDTLEATGQRENTVVAFTADHGLAVGRHGLMGKQNVHAHSVRVPLVVAGPGVPGGERRDALTVHYDLYPTLADLAGVDAPATASASTTRRSRTGHDAPRHRTARRRRSNRQFRRFAVRRAGTRRVFAGIRPRGSMDFDPDRFEEEKYAGYFAELETAYRKAFETMNERFDSGLVHAIDQRVLAESEPFYGDGGFRVELPADPAERVSDAGVVVDDDRVERVLDRYVEELEAELADVFGLDGDDGPKA